MRLRLHKRIHRHQRKLEKKRRENNGPLRWVLWNEKKTEH